MSETPDAIEPSVRVLGPVALVRDGVPLTPRSEISRALLGALAVASPASLAPGYLVATVWGDRPLGDAKATLQLAVFRLRRWLRETAGDAVSVRTGPDGYRLDLGGAGSDLARFRTLAAAADGGYAALAEAIGLWRGDPLANVPTARTDPRMVATLREEHAAAARRCAAAAMAEGAADAAISVLRPLCVEDPLDEEAHALLIEALAMTGLRGAALGEFDRVRRRLATELGVEPGLQLRTTYQRLLGPPKRTEKGTGPRTAAWHGPRPVTTLIGRDRDRTALAHLLGEHRIVTITGPGGVGKTALALDTAQVLSDRYPDGIAVAMLADVTTAEEAALTIGRSIGAADTRCEGAASGPRILVILDNCEHLLTDIGPIVRRLDAITGIAAVLATSRRPLGISGEAVWRLEPLRTPAEDDAPDRASPAM